MSYSDETEEIIQTIGRLRAEFEDLAVRGLRATGPERLSMLDSVREEFVRIGAGHLAERIEQLCDAIRNDDRTAASALMRAQTSLRLFERMLTLEVVGATLASSLADDEFDADLEQE